MNDRQLECFVRVAETCSFRAAAKALYISQPAVTQQIKSLERTLGVALFERDTAHVRLTGEGEAFLQHAVPLLKAMREAEGLFKAETTLTLNYFFSDGLDEVARYVRAHMPQTRLRPVRIKAIDTLGALARRPGSLTFVERELVVGIPDIAFAPVWEVVEQVVVGPQNPLAGRTSCTTADLAGQTMLRYFAPGAQRDEGLDLRSRPELAGNPSIRCDSVDEALDMVHADCGVALLLLPRDVDTPGLAHIPLDPPSTTVLGAAHLRRHETPELSLLVEAVRHVYVESGRRLTLS